jgi:hypothetical protein
MLSHRPGMTVGLSPPIKPNTSNAGAPFDEMR